MASKRLFRDTGRTFHAVAHPVPGLNPTSGSTPLEKAGSEETQASNSHDRSRTLGEAAGVYAVRRSRDNRKGRHAILVLWPAAVERPKAEPPATNTWRGLADGLLRMVTRFPVWDVSYDVALIFTIGT